MKTLCVLLFLSFFIGQCFAQAENELKELTLEGEEYTPEAAYEAGMTRDNNQRQIDLYNLQKAKFKMINGDLSMAEFYLGRISEKESTIAIIKKKYLAIIHFINGRFDLSLKELNNKIVNHLDYYPQNCLLRLIDFIAVNDIDSLKREKDLCKSVTEKYSKNDQYWLDSMIKLKLQDARGVQKNLLTDVQTILKDDEAAKLWLKTGLYLNKEEDLLKLISMLPESAYQSKKLREIVAFMYLRSGDTKKALSFVDDIDTANAENIKGNINLLNKEYELAFGHFKLALQKKQDSSNSLERAIPLAWMLKEWSEGLNMLSNSANKELDPRNRAAVRIAFLIRDKKLEQARDELTLLKIAFKNEPPFEVNIMDTYVNLILSQTDKNYDRRKLEESAEKSCRLFDGMSCWMALQFSTWENVGKTITRNEPTFSDKSMTVESLKEKKEITPLVETKNIDQSDVEELDGETIKITPQQSRNLP